MAGDGTEVEFWLKINMKIVEIFHVAFIELKAMLSPHNLGLLGYFGRGWSQFTFRHRVAMMEKEDLYVSKLLKNVS